MTQVMTESKPEQSPDVFADALDATAARCDDWLADVRAAARAKYESLGLPTTKHEDWRYTNVKAIAATDFADADASAIDPAAFKQFDQFDIPDLQPARMVFLNGKFAPELSDFSGLRAGVTVLPLARAIAEQRELVEPYLGRLTHDSNDAFTALNTAMIDAGLFVHVAEGVEPIRPIEILNIADSDQPFASHTRNLVVAERGAKVTVLEHYVTTRPGSVYLNNGVTEVFADDEAVVHHYLLERDSEQAFNIANLKIRLGERSDVHSHTVLLGGSIVRNNVRPTFTGADAHCLINGLFVGHNDQHLDNAMHVVHAAPNCRSRQFYKGIMNDRSHGVFTGRIVVEEAGQQTDAVQSNRNMLLTDDARMNARPQLEIYADDVKCTHGATTGQVDPEAVFYFRARGLPEDVARAMLIYAFAAEGFDRMQLVPVRELLAGEMIAKLPMAEKLSAEFSREIHERLN